ncbi:mediator of RNA polymerase II transcription subunit 27 [Entomortierella parvispora]|uniref:Mediator of RNA polymerase II transcription subunit 27 n=1 Tax=Entomortierella parvispora TaxID=205924 RepID=A0A9P3HL69_9FUNG|nr:mediator of RNA polymerase II transcription subunit 27 [Entomortierella parvispora]
MPMSTLLPTDPEEVQAAIKKNQNALQDIEHMITSLNDVRSSVHHIFHILQGRAELESGAAFREHAKFTYTALECLTKLALSSDAQLNDAQALELPKLQGPSPISLESKQKEAQNERNSDESSIRGAGHSADEASDAKKQEYLLLSIDDTIRWFTRSMKKAGRKVYATRPEVQPSLPFATVKVNVAGVMNVIIVMETNKRGRCISISRLAVFGAGEETSVWEDSSHLVFKKISQVAVGAIDHFMAQEPRSLLGLVLEWISNYGTLFTAPCMDCKKHLYFDSQQFKHLPPTLYTYSDKSPSGRPYHLQCYS